MGKTPNTFSSGFSNEDYRNLLSAGIAIEGRRVGPASLFIEIQSGKPGRPPFFIIGTLMLEIIQAVAKDHPIYCAPPSWYLLRNPKRYIADTAAFLAREILSIKPDGPYLIGGYCFHGWISFEIARILRASKRNVDLLFFLDDRAPHRWLRSSLAYIRKLLFQPKRKGQEAIERPIAETDNHLFENHPSIIELRTAAANYYKNGRPIYRGHTDIILHNSESQIKNFLDMLDWKGLIRGRLHVKFIKGYHDWKNPKQVLEFKRVIIKSLGESQKIADRRKNTH